MRVAYRRDCIKLRNRRIKKPLVEYLRLLLFYDSFNLFARLFQGSDDDSLTVKDDVIGFQPVNIRDQSENPVGK